jgi:hypothetical protein
VWVEAKEGCPHGKWIMIRNERSWEDRCEQSITDEINGDYERYARYSYYHRQEAEEEEAPAYCEIHDSEVYDFDMHYESMHGGVWYRRTPVLRQLVMRVRLLTIKKDLIAAAYHPSRVERWLEIGGFDLLEAIMG